MVCEKQTKLIQDWLFKIIFVACVHHPIAIVGGNSFIFLKQTKVISWYKIILVDSTSGKTSFM